MSTQTILKQAIKEGHLCQLIPALGQTPRRTLLVHHQLDAILSGVATHRSIGGMRRYLEGFVMGGAITMGFTPRSHGSAMMGRLDPVADHTWDFRCVDPSPAIRVFGKFACRDVFVALEWAPRSKAIPGYDRRPLCDSDSIEWHIALGQTQKLWSQILPNIKPLSGNKPSDYLSENASRARNRK